EIGGFVEDLLSSALSLSEAFTPLTSIVFGEEATASEVRSIETDWAIPLAGEFKPPFAIALARLDPEVNDDWSYGRDASPALAHTKAVAEAREWAACSFVSTRAVRTSFARLRSAIDPRTVINFHPEQYRGRKFPFAPFD